MLGYDWPRLHAALNDLPAALLLMAVLFAGSVVAWAAAGRAFGPRVALAVALLLLLVLLMALVRSPRPKVQRRTTLDFGPSWTLDTAIMPLDWDFRQLV